MDFSDAVRMRKSVRKYLDRDIDEKKLRSILEIGLRAPSARNEQPWRFLVIRDPEKRKQLARAAKNQQFVAEAPVVLAACGVNVDHVMTCGQPAYTVDVSVAVDHITLAAPAEGLGTCWIGAFHEDEAKAILGVPENVRIVALLTIGYPAENPPPTSRATFESRVATDMWPDAWSVELTGKSTEEVENKKTEPAEKPLPSTAAQEAAASAADSGSSTAEAKTPSEKSTTTNTKKSTAEKNSDPRPYAVKKATVAKKASAPKKTTPVRNKKTTRKAKA